MTKDIKDFASPQDQFMMLLNFLQSVNNDPRIGPSHICVYLSLIALYQPMYCVPVVISKKEIILSAKISKSTFHRAIKDLEMSGYVNYHPSYDPYAQSKVMLCYCANFKF